MDLIFVSESVIPGLLVATGPDRDLDKLVALAVNYAFDPDNNPSFYRSFYDHAAKHDYQSAFIAHEPWLSDNVPNFTASVDCSLKLITQIFPNEWGIILREAVSELGKKHDWHMVRNFPEQLDELPSMLLAVMLIHYLEIKKD